MATLVKLPQFGVTMLEATVVAWLKGVGDHVERGDAVASIETDKLSQEVTANASGVLRRIVAPVGETIKVMQAMAVIASPDEPESVIDSLLGVAPAKPTPVAADAPIQVAVSAISAVPPADEVRASPLARRLAREFGIDLAQVHGSGPGGRIVEEDVRAHAASVVARVDRWVLASPLARRRAREAGIDLATVPGTGPDGRVVERDVEGAIEARAEAPAIEAAVSVGPTVAPALTRRATHRFDAMRRIISDRMTASLRDTAQLTLVAEADATALVALRGALVPAAKIYGHRSPTYTDLIVAIVARTLRQHPRLNSSLVQGPGGAEVAEWQEINIGVAVALENGLVVPVVRDADSKPLQAISQEVADLAEAARAGRLDPDAFQGGSFTVTNLGQMEVDAFTPIVNPPQAAILGVGRIAKRPAVVDDVLAVRSMVTLSLTIDHRIVDGAPGGAFLRDVRRAIESGTL
jgi:pyruvate dehydrogenase E2 component (dihydrolipoamide acetyltransferase)